MGWRKQEVPSEMTATTHVSDVCCVGLHFHTKLSDLICPGLVLQISSCCCPGNGVSPPHSNLFHFMCCTGVLSPVTVDYSRNSFLSSLNHWKCERAISKHRFLLLSISHLGTQRAHPLPYPSLLWTVFMYSSNGQLQHNGKIFNCDLSVFPYHLLHSCCIKIHPWCAKQTSGIIMDIHWKIFELSIIF